MLFSNIEISSLLNTLLILYEWLNKRRKTVLNWNEIKLERGFVKLQVLINVRFNNKMKYIFLGYHFIYKDAKKVASGHRWRVNVESTVQAVFIESQTLLAKRRLSRHRQWRESICPPAARTNCRGNYDTWGPLRVSFVSRDISTAN